MPIIFVLVWMYFGAGYYVGNHANTKTVIINGGNYTLDIGDNLAKFVNKTSCDDVNNYDCSYTYDYDDYENGGCEMLLKSRNTIKP
jgi:hypothetical protein